MRRFALVVAAIGCCAATGASSPVTELAGRYSHHFKNGAIDGSIYWSDDVIEIVPVDARHAYFNIALEFFNGHECNAYGIAEVKGDTLDYVGRMSGSLSEDQPPCHMSLARRGAAFALDDHDGTCQMTCGARGGYAHATLPWSSKRAITYMPRLLGSAAYRNAVSEWKQHP